MCHDGRAGALQGEQGIVVLEHYPSVRDLQEHCPKCGKHYPEHLH